MGTLSGITKGSYATKADSTKWIMPDESHPHERTWMAFGASKKIWGSELLPRVQRDLALIANTIVNFEPVSMLVRAEEVRKARQLLDPKVEIVICELDDLWIRDTGPVFVLNEQGEKAAIDFNFNGWGNKQTHLADAKVAEFVINQLGVTGLPTRLVSEGGCIEVDGLGTAIMTESCTLNANRNPGIAKSRFEDLIAPILGVEKVIWLPGIRGMDITDGHTDFYARFAKPGVVLAGYEPDESHYDHQVTLRHLEILKSSTEVKGRKLQIILLEAPTNIRPRWLSDDFASGYIGYYVCNNAVIMQNFGDKRADAAAKSALQSVYPERTVVLLNVDGIAAGGGSIHCATQQEPALVT
ncbi:porphyromonas-type peptidyl-arginine deiminase [Planctobacterium marinum]|uniref:Porphyromonas-type peptidyl-arginine deiminase n=2 Tax=Planctobacterium marinum TaxID=1631968 RepID=A0AA48HM88_9ALTE|nr:porphyromonas-type peptidyl-arginine deiminase [Planctobacterium marinum]